MNCSKSVARVSIGILAHNSAETVGETIQSLLKQSLIANERADFAVEIIVVPNGCVDETAKVSNSVLAAAGLPKHVSFRVCELDTAGKCNAWNEFVHHLSHGSADFLVLMDSDITFLAETTVENLIGALKADGSAHISIDEPIKDVALKDKRTWWEWLSVKVSDVARKNVPSICGQLYAGTGSCLRRIWLPVGLPVEDGFLRAMVLTGGFRGPEQFGRIVRATDASHRFEAHLGTKNLLLHEEWLIAASTLNTFIYDFLWKACEDGQDAGDLIRDLNESDPDWLEKMAAKRLSEKIWVIPPNFVFRRFFQLRQFPLSKALPQVPIALAAFFVDCIICYRANRKLKRNKSVQYWRTAPQSNGVPAQVKAYPITTSNHNDEVRVS